MNHFIKKLGLSVAVLAVALLPLLAFAITTFITPQGGTGATSFPQGSIIQGNGVNPLSGTYSPSVLTITATSTATSSLLLNLTSVNSTTSQATTSYLNISTLASTSQLRVSSNTALANATGTNIGTTGAFNQTGTATSTLAGGLSTNLLNVTSASASSTFGNGINLTKGCFSINNNCVGSPVLTIGPTNVPSAYLVDGVADQVQCNNALADLKALGGGTLLVKNFTYNFSEFCGVSAASNITFEGESRGAIINVGFTDTAGQGALSFYNSTNGNPFHNITIKNLTINMGSRRTPGILFQGVQSAATTSRHMLVENVEFVGGIGDVSGSRGRLKIEGAYSSILGGFEDVRVTKSLFRDNESGGAGTVAVGIYAVSDNLVNFTVDHTEFNNLYGASIGYISGQLGRTRRNFVFDHNRFYHTQKFVPGDGTLGTDIQDSGQTGVQGISITNNYFEGQASDVTQVTNQQFNMMIYASEGVTIDNNEFHNSHVVYSAGDTAKGNIGTTFTNNRMFDIRTFMDPDSDHTAIYDGNIFYNVGTCPIIYGYGIQYPKKISNNMIAGNLCTIVDTSKAYTQAPFLMEEGGIILEGNTVYSTSSAGTMGYIFTEIGNTNTTDPIIYRNNHVFGTGAGTTTFYLNSLYTHIIQNNSGINESKIQNHYNNLTESAQGTDLTATDIVSNNITLKNTPTQNATNFGWYVGIGTTTPNSLLTVSATSSLSNRPLVSVVGPTLNNSATSTFFSVTANGFLGIGTSTPQSMFHVASSTTATTTTEFGDQYSANSKSCFNIKTNTGTAGSFFFTTSGLVFENNRCR